VAAGGGRRGWSSPVGAGIDGASFTRTL